MHMRNNRNPGNGYGSAVGSRSSPEGGPTRGPGFYKSESMSFNRSFSRNQCQNHQRNFYRPPPAPPMPARADVFMEVGRLAAEYLVSRGVLPPSALPAKWQNGSSKKPLSEFQEFRPHEEENMQSPGEARTSALARLGNTGFGADSGRRKYNDDYGTSGLRNHARGKRKGGASRNYSSDWGREYGRTGSWSDRHRDRTSLSPDLDRDSSSKRRGEHPLGKDNVERAAGDYDSSSKRHEEKEIGKDDDRMDVDQDARSRLHMEPVFGKGDSDTSELTGTSAAPPPKGVDYKDSESERKYPDVVKDTSDVTNGEINTDSLDLGGSRQMTENTLGISGEAAEVDPRNKGEITGDIDDPSRDETVKVIVSEDPTPENFATHASLSEKCGTDLKALSKFANVPTRIRSSLAKAAKGRSILSCKGVVHIGPTESMVNDKNLGVSTNDGSSGGCDEPKVPNSEIPADLTPRVVEGEKRLQFDDSVGPARELESENSLGDGKPVSASPLDQASGSRPESSEDGMLENEQSLNGELHSSGSGDPVAEKRGEKRPHGGIDKDGQHARRKEWLSQSTKDWLSPTSTNAGKCSNLANPVSSQVDIIGGCLFAGKNKTRVSRSCSDSNIELPEVTTHEPNFMDTEEKQFFPSSFKICDLNLMESADSHENQDRDAIFMYPPSVAAAKKSVSPVDINLSICNSVTSVGHSKCVAGRKEIEIIDLEGDSAPEDKTLSITERRTENAFMGLEEFSTPAPNTAGIPDSQDGYSLMISELLTNDFPGITPIPGDVSALNNMGLHNGEAPLADDDPIYMSLGEIPFLRFVQDWENPAQPQDGKPF